MSKGMSGRSASACSSLRLPTKHHGHTVSETMSICMEREDRANPPRCEIPRPCYPCRTGTRRDRAMKPIDYAKAFALAFVIWVMLFQLSYPVVWVYSVLIAPGPPAFFYQVAALEWLVPLWIHIAGPIYFF